MREWNAKNKEKINKERKERREKDPERLRGYQKTAREKIRKEILSYYSNDKLECACCGEDEYEFLSIDHINNDGAEHRREINVKGGMDMYMWIKKNEFPNIFQILCHNCNWLKRHPSGICIHKRKEGS